MNRKLIFLLLFLLLCYSAVAAGAKHAAKKKAKPAKAKKTAKPAKAAKPAAKPKTGTFDVKKYGARADGRTDDAKAFTAAWTAACSSSGSVTLVIPRGTYLAGPVKFKGPCRNVQAITINVQGYIKASTNLNLYTQGDDWIEFGWIDKLTLTGGGTFDGQGAVAWPKDKCPTTKNCRVLPTSLKFVSTTNTVVKEIKSVNSKFFHVALVTCKNFWASGLSITAPENSPNTDGIHIDRSTDVTVYSSVIGTGDDCVSIGHGCSNVLISGITCGPGHGISVGSLGRYDYEEDVRGLVVRDSTLTGTMFGVRIKTWESSPKSTSATNMTFDDIVMNGVGNPIYIDQMYCPYASCDNKSPSKVKLSDVTFRNVRGTSSTPMAVTLKCSPGVPCKNVRLQDVNLRYIGRKSSTSTCSNVKANYIGKQIPPPCK